MGSGLDLLAQVRDMGVPTSSRVGVPHRRHVHRHGEARSGDLDGAIELRQAALDNLFGSGDSSATGATATLVEILLAVVPTVTSPKHRPRSTGWRLSPLTRGTSCRAAAAADAGTACAGAGEEDGYRAYRDRYRTMATDLGFEGHMKWAEEMT